MTHNSSTFSSIVAEAVSGSHVIKIDGYSRIKVLVRNGHNWVIRFYPNGDSAESQDYLSFYLILDSANSYDVKVIFSFELLDKSGRSVSSYTGTTDLHTFSYKGSLWGYAKFIHQNVLEESSSYLRDDSFSIRCDIKVFKEIYSQETRGDHKQFVEVPPSNLNQHLRELLDNKDGADVVFDVGEESFSAHRCVLAARSSVFKAELLGIMKENANKPIQIDDIEPAVFKSLLHFIYTDSLDVMAQEDQSREGCEDLVMAQHLLVAADRYNIERLKLICEERLCENIDSNMVATSLALADQHNCYGLKEACFEFLASPSNLLEMMAKQAEQSFAFAVSTQHRYPVRGFQFVQTTDSLTWPN
uniref:BTB domain-containing protein n=1 Tax=Leersia perrieri TaxID=77586 RepID=A0A0D9VF94_9ORYZ